MRRDSEPKMSANADPNPARKTRKLVLNIITHLGKDVIRPNVEISLHFVRECNFSCFSAVAFHCK